MITSFISSKFKITPQLRKEITTSPYDVPEDPAKDITSDEALKGKPMSPDEFLIVNENRQRQREINGDQPEYVNFNNAATKFLLDQVKIPYGVNSRQNSDNHS